MLGFRLNWIIFPKSVLFKWKENFVADIITRYQTQNIKELVDEDKILGQTLQSREIETTILPRLEAIELENLNESQVHKIQTSLEQQQHDLKTMTKSYLSNCLN